MTESKRQVPEPLKKLLKFDSYITNEFVTRANAFLPLRTLKTNGKAFEISCHGIPWFAFWIAFTWLFNNPHLVQLQVNMLLGLFLDITFVAVAKAYFRRKRPAPNKEDALGQVGPDVFSFPSGHASRAVFVAYFFTVLWPVNIFFYPPILAWAVAVCLSRLMMSRHYVLDVVGGVILGILEALLLGLLWIEDDTARSLLSYISDEKLDGGEYHV